MKMLQGSTLTMLAPMAMFGAALCAMYSSAGWMLTASAIIPAPRGPVLKILGAIPIPVAAACPAHHIRQTVPALKISGSIGSRSTATLATLNCTALGSMAPDRAPLMQLHRPTSGIYQPPCATWLIRPGKVLERLSTASMLAGEVWR